MADILVLGSLNMDLVAVSSHLPRRGETLLGRQFLMNPGGKGANQAFAAARLGGSVAMLGRVGTDDYGRRMLENLQGSGCDVSGVAAVSGASGVALILTAEDAENMIVVVPGANERFAPDGLIGEEARFAGARFLLLQLETPIATVTAAAMAAKKAGATVILDPAPAVPTLPSELLRHVDILTPNESEACLLLGRKPAQLHAGDFDPIVDALQALGVQQVILKLGAQGCYLAEGDTRVHVPAPEVAVVDTTAAGDAFNGALAAACSEGASLLDGCRFAVRAAALSVTRLGAQQAMADRAELTAAGLFSAQGAAPRSGTENLCRPV